MDCFFCDFCILETYNIRNINKVNCEMHGIYFFNREAMIIIADSINCMEYRILATFLHHIRNNNMEKDIISKEDVEQSVDYIINTLLGKTQKNID